MPETKFKQMHAVTLAIDLNEAAKILGLESLYHLPNGVWGLVPRIEGGSACFDFVSDESFQLGPMKSFCHQVGMPLAHYKLSMGDKPYA